MTTTAQHTPGPWHTDAHGLIYAEDSKLGKVTVAQSDLCSDGSGRMGKLLSNARLIAAAPELLTALESALAWVTVLTETSAGNAEDMRETEHKRDYLGTELRAAIAKARGEG